MSLLPEHAAEDATREERLDYLNEMVRRRGYTSRSHNLLAANDFGALKAFNPIPIHVYVKSRALDAPVKETCLVAGFSCLKGPRYALQTHMRKAVALGVPALDLIEVFGTLAPHVDLSTTLASVESWLEVFDGELSGSIIGEGGMADDNALRQWKPMLDVLDTSDPALAERIRVLLGELYVRPRRLDPRTKELALVMALICRNSDRERMMFHMRRALDLGASETELLETIELAIPHAGLLAFEQGLLAWADLTGAPELRPDGVKYSKAE